MAASSGYFSTGSPAGTCRPGLWRSGPSSEQKVALRHRQHIGWFAPQQLAIGLDLIVLRIHLDVRQVVVVDQVRLLHLAATFDHANLFLQPELLRHTGIERCLT